MAANGLREHVRDWPVVSAVGRLRAGQCPVVVAPSAPRSAAPVDDRAIVRVANTRGSGRSLGSGTLIDNDQQRGLVITCAHLFRDGAGTIDVTFPTRRAFRAELARLDANADLAALWIAAPGVEPVSLATESPQRGDPLTSCGYGSDGTLACNRGQALGYVSTVGSGAAEVLELSGAVRMGDSGGPVFNTNRQLVAVLFGTNGRVVDATSCGRIRRFLSGLSPRFGAVPSAPPAQTGNLRRRRRACPTIGRCPCRPRMSLQPGAARRADCTPARSLAAAEPETRGIGRHRRDRKGRAFKRARVDTSAASRNTIGRRPARSDC